MKQFVILDNIGNHCAYVRAENERQALCKYLMAHEELEDMMLWKAADNNMWKLAEYDCEEEYLTARELKFLG